MQGHNVFAKDYRTRGPVFAARDRCDETVERIRSVRTDRFLYIRNFHPQRPHLQPNAYNDGKSIVTDGDGIRVGKVRMNETTIT